MRIKLEGESHTEHSKDLKRVDPVNLKEPYMNEEDIKKNNEFKRNTENRREVLEMYKFKITKLKSFNQNSNSNVQHS